LKYRVILSDTNIVHYKTRYLLNTHHVSADRHHQAYNEDK